MHSILFHIGPVPIHSYGLMIVIGFMLGLWRATRVAKNYKLNPDSVMDAAVLALIAGIVGARILFLFLEVPHEGWGIFAGFYKVWEGGLSFHGGLVAALFAVGGYCKSKKIPFLVLADVLAPSVAIGYAFARIGCFLNGCCYGQPTNLPWAVRFIDPVTHASTAPSHPAQLYAFAINLGIFWILTRIARLNKPAGFVFFSYVTLYSVYRFLIEFIRKGVTAQVCFAGLTQAQVASLAAIVVFGLALVFINRTKPAAQPTRKASAKKRN